MNTSSFFTPERRWVLIFAFLVMLLTSVPYIMGYAMQGEEWRFTGFVFGVEDGNAFIGKMLSGTAGDWLFRTPYTASPQRGFLIFLPYILLGKLASSPGAHEQLVALYHIFRVIAGSLAILSTYEFLSFFIINVKYRRFGLVLVTLGGGLGWLLILLNLQGWLGSIPLEFYSPESFGFLSLYIYPHYALARAFLLYGLLMYLKSSRRINEIQSTFREGIKVGVVWLLTGFAQPLTGMVVGAVVIIYICTLLLWQVWLWFKRFQVNWAHLWKLVKLSLWSSLLPAPFVLYNLVSSELDPFLKVWTEQSYFGSPHPVYYILAYGLILPFAIYGGIYFWRSEDWSNKLPVAWAIFLPILVYAPIGIQRRLPEGIWVALVVMAMKALEIKSKKTISRIGAILLFAFPSTILLISGGVLLTIRTTEPIYRPSAEIVAFQSLAMQPRRSHIVLSSYETGNALPAWAPVFVVIGHGPESVGLSELIPRVNAFYQVGTTDTERIKLLSELNIDYVFWGPKERSIGGWDPKMAIYLSLIYQKDDYYIFLVMK